ncbi:hypothetical protein ATN89_17365 [Comamonas thiooxydans]|nr:hypothetical protein ATN89_17365 [Comamonas thiooxydans]
MSMLIIDEKFREKEPDALQRKWFDYRLLHPTEATYLWAHFYNEQAKKFYATCKDTGTADSVVGIAPADALRSREANSVWRARQVLDKIGCPYPWALQFLMRRAINNGWRTFPRPNQMYGYDSVVDLYNAWKERVARELTYSREPFFLALQWEEHPVQVAHIEFVVDQLSKRAAPRHRLVSRLIKEGVLDEALATRFFPAEAEAALLHYKQFK